MAHSLSEKSYTGETRESIITKLRDAVSENGGSVDYELEDNCPDDGEDGYVTENIICRTLHCSGYAENFSYDDIETDILQDILDNLLLDE